MQYSHEERKLVVWHWFVNCESPGDWLITFHRPVNDRGERVTPSDFDAYRMSHDVLGPCCLCPFQHSDVGHFKESAIFMVGHGRFAGEYVAACAEGRCDYFGDSN